MIALELVIVLVSEYALEVLARAMLSVFVSLFELVYVSGEEMGVE
jgi:hypothetical protein